MNLWKCLRQNFTEIYVNKSHYFCIKPNFPYYIRQNRNIATFTHFPTDSKANGGMMIEYFTEIYRVFIAHKHSGTAYRQDRNGTQMSRQRHLTSMVISVRITSSDLFIHTEICRHALIFGMYQTAGTVPKCTEMYSQSKLNSFNCF